MFSLKRRPAATASPPKADDDPRLGHLLTLQALDGSPLERLHWANERGLPFRYTPASFRLSLDLSSWRTTCPSFDSVQLDLPAAWVSDRARWRPCPSGLCEIQWTITPCEEPETLDPRISVTALEDGHPLQTIGRSLAVALEGTSQFDPERDAFRQVNSVAGWGIVTPRADIFERTYASVLFPTKLFDGLYRAIVFIGGNLQGYGGGLCTGMARAALERSFGGGSDESDLELVLLWHGRQLTDRALLASARWLLRASPKRAFEAFRRDLVHTGETRRCFDIEVPKPWRRDIISALQREGHTVVPYAFRQSSAGRAEVLVYDPNDPTGSIAGRAVITFDLTADTYAYRDIISLDDHRTTVIAVDQDVYRRGRTAILAGLVSALLRLGQSVRRTPVPA